MLLRFQSTSGPELFLKIPSPKTVKCPYSVEELVPFKNDMMDMIKNLEFKRVSNKFQ